MDIVYFGNNSISCCEELGDIEVFISSRNDVGTLFVSKQKAVVIGNIGHLWTLNFQIPVNTKLVKLLFKFRRFYRFMFLF